MLSVSQCAFKCLLTILCWIYVAHKKYMYKGYATTLHGKNIIIYLRFQMQYVLSIYFMHLNLLSLTFHHMKTNINSSLRLILYDNFSFKKCSSNWTMTAVESYCIFGFFFAFLFPSTWLIPLFCYTISPLKDISSKGVFSACKTITNFFLSVTHYSNEMIFYDLKLSNFHRNFHL